MQGWICLHRQILEWEWYSDINTRCLFIHCLLRANHADTRWKGHDIKRGQFITSLESLSKETGLTISQVRTSLRKLEMTNEVTSKPQAKSRMVTVVGYDSYQANRKQDDRQIASKSQANSQEDSREVATDNNDNNEKQKKHIKDSFDFFWKNWINCKKAIGLQGNYGDKQKSFDKYKSKMKNKDPEFISAEVNKMVNYMVAVYSDIAECDETGRESVFFNFRNMHAQKLIGNEGWNND